jgi:hypothetical protein
MKICTFFSVVTFLALFSSAAFATCPEGSFIAKGWNPGVDTAGKESYTGTVSIKSVGNVCVMEWLIGGQVFSGIGAYNPSNKIFNVSYANLKEGWFGLVWYLDNGNTLEGKWVVAGTKDGRLGYEILTRK